jgi:hypothetical protein
MPRYINCYGNIEKEILNSFLELQGELKFREGFTFDVGFE